MELMSNKHIKICKILNYTDHLLILASTITGRVSIFEFSSLVGISVVIAALAITIKTWLINASIKKYKQIIIKKAEKTW